MSTRDRHDRDRVAEVYAKACCTTQAARITMARHPWLTPPLTYHKNAAASSIKQPGQGTTRCYYQQGKRTNPQTPAISTPLALTSRHSSRHCGSLLAVRAERHVTLFPARTLTRREAPDALVAVVRVAAVVADEAGAREGGRAPSVEVWGQRVPGLASVTVD